MNNRKHALGLRARRAAIFAAALGAGVTHHVGAAVTGGTGQEFVVRTTGATALLAFTSAAGNRGPYLLGQETLVIGGSTYTIDNFSGQAFGIQNRNTPVMPPEPGAGADRIVYQYHSTGSINGVRELVRAQGLLNVTPFPVSPSNQLFVMGQPLNSQDGSALTNGYNSTVPAGTYNPFISYSDVRAEQGFAISGTGAVNTAPLVAGYGEGRPNSLSGRTGTSFQTLTSVGSLDDSTDTFAAGADTLANRVRNESLAVVPFTISASPGTGLDNVTEADAQFLNTTGRLKNGANFNFVTRDIGSGTRNQGANNFNIDPSWASGERDRRATVVTNTTDRDGNAATVQVGEEQNPALDLDGVGVVNVNEHRPSVLSTYSDKTSGSTGVRQRVTTSRMALGILSAGDVGTRGTVASNTDPVRVLGIDFAEDNAEGGEPAAGPVQPTATNVTEGRYQMWSASQAVTVTNLAGGADAIKGDVNDGTGTGVGRKFLNNINSSAASGPNPSTPATPFDAIVEQGFIPNGIMAVNKLRDGSRQFSDARSTVDNPATGFSEQEIWDAVVNGATVFGLDGPDEGTEPDAFTGSGTLGNRLNWVTAGSHNGNITAQTYKVWDVGNASGTADVLIPFSARVFLAGDLDGDSVRDFKDVRQLAQAFANTTAYLGSNPTVTTSANPSASANLDVSPITGATQAATNQLHALLALSDLDGDGNVVPVGAPGTGGGADQIAAAVSRKDVLYFLDGAAIDTESANAATGYAGSADAQTRREQGVRLGRLRKNAAYRTFNSELDAIGGAAVALKVNRFDVNRDGAVNRADAAVVDRNILKNFTDLNIVLGSSDDLIAAELTDDSVITHVDPSPGTSSGVAEGVDFTFTSDGDLQTKLAADSDFQQLRKFLGTSLRDGDTDFDGDVDLADLGRFATFFDQTDGTLWSEGNFDFDSDTDLNDLGALATNFDGGRQAAYAAFESLVPESSAAALLIALLPAGTLRRRRRSTTAN